MKSNVKPQLPDKHIQPDNRKARPDVRDNPDHREGEEQEDKVAGTMHNKKAHHTDQAEKLGTMDCALRILKSRSGTVIAARKFPSLCSASPLIAVLSCWRTFVRRIIKMPILSSVLPIFMFNPLIDQGCYLIRKKSSIPSGSISTVNAK